MPARGGCTDPSVQPPRAGIGQLLADVVQLAVEPGDGPADPRRTSGRRRNLADARRAPRQGALTQGDHEQLLVRGEQDTTDGHLSAVVLLGMVWGHRHEGRVVDDDLEV